MNMKCNRLKTSGGVNMKCNRLKTKKTVKLLIFDQWGVNSYSHKHIFKGYFSLKIVRVCRRET